LRPGGRNIKRFYVWFMKPGGGGSGWEKGQKQVSPRIHKRGGK